MKVAIISDVHANPQALERVLEDATRCGVEQVVCAGDVVGPLRRSLITVEAKEYE